MYTVDNNNITLTRGDSVPINFELLDSEGNVVTPKETDKFIFTVRKDYKKDASDIVCAFRKEIVDGVLKIDPKDTYNLPYGKYVWDIQYIYNDEADVATVLKGELCLTEEVG